MHHRTYARQRRRYLEAEACVDEAFNERAARMAARW
jgi:hypothetical protein